MRDLVNNLKVSLQGPLPGVPSQKEMLASQASGAKIKFHHQGPPKRGGVTILLYPHNTRWYLPLMKRPPYQGVHSGQISFPGGKMESQDQDLIDTALRETGEEIGVFLDRTQVIGQLSTLYISASHFEVLPVVVALSKAPEFNTDDREVASLIRADMQDLLDPLSRKEKIIRVRNTDIHAPYFEVQSEVVWGATAMILNELLTLIRESV